MTKRMILGVLALAGIFVALYLLLYKLGMIGHLSCSVGSCETVNTSKWAKFMGAPVAAWGVAYYVGLFVLAIVSTGERYADSLGMSKLLTLVAATGFLFSVYLTYLELFQIHAICQWCVISAVIVTLIFIVSLADLREKKADSVESAF
jgi:uncharacterized membrane protein